MRYADLIDVYEYLEKTPARLKKVDAIADLFKKTGSELLPKVALLVQGKVFSSWSEEEIGIASQMMIKIISIATGFSENEVTSRFNKSGDFGLVVEGLIERKKQRTLFSKPLTVDKVFDNLQKLAGIEGKGSQERKFQLVSELISSAGPKEAKYIVRTTIGDLRIGVAEGVVRDAIAKAFLEDQGEQKEIASAVEWAWFLRPDYGEIAKIAKERGLKGLNNVKLEVGKPYNVLLSEKAPSLEEALKEFENPAIETKYDGARVCIHKKGEDVSLYTRRLENITKQFPDLIELARKCVRANECVIEGEMLGIDPKRGEPMPFQSLSQRIKRKYDIEKMIKEIPIQMNLFDIVYLNGKMLFDMPLKERRKELEKIIKPIPGKFQLAKQLVTKDLRDAEKFYKESLAAKQEGVMVKNLDSTYQPGRRVGYWLKVKPIMETLDLAIIGATWGTGKRAGWLGSLILGCRDQATGTFLECGMLGTGIKEKKVAPEDVTFEELTKMLKPNIISESGSEVKVRPKVVLEIAYEEIQKSPNYASGFALRFPRLVRLRTLEKAAGQCDTLERVKYLYRLQKK